MNTGGGEEEKEEEEEEKTLSVESMCKSCLILQLTDKKLAKEDAHRRRRRRALHFAKSTHNFVCSLTQTDKKLVKEDGHRRKKKKKRLHLWNPCTIHVCSPKNSRKLQKKKEDRRRSFASYTKA
jgi:hypothetical protein